MKTYGLDLLGLLMVAGFIMFYGLGSVPLFDPDEPVYIQTAVEMLNHNDFISPRIYGDFWFDKPPFYYWAVAAAVYLFGPTEFAARFPSAIFAVIGVVGVYFAGRQFFSRRVGLMAGLVLATSIEYFYLGKAAVTDSTLNCFFAGALLFYLNRSYYWMYICMGLAVLTKGPVGVILPAIIIGLHLLATQSLNRIRKMHLLWGSLIVFVIAAPWYAIMYQIHGKDFIDTFLGFHNITRFLEPEHTSGAVWYYYFPVLAVGFFPWVTVLLQAVFAAWQERKGETGEVLQLLLIWAGVIFLFFSASQTKLVSYILPMFPPLALLVGWYWNNMKIKKYRLALLLMALVSMGIFLALEAASIKAFDMTVAGVWWSGAVLFFMNILWFYFNVRKKPMMAFGGVVVSVTLFVVVLMTSVLPAAAAYVSVKETANVFHTVYQKAQANIYIERFYRPGFCFYTGLPGRELNGDMRILLEDKNPAYFLVREDTYLNLPDFQRQSLQIINQQAKMMLVYKQG